MRLLACTLASVCLVIAGCSADTDDSGGASTSTDALTALTATQCKTPTVHTKAKEDDDGAPIAGSAHTTLSGCIVGKRNETGEEVLQRLVTLLGDTSKLAGVTNDQGEPVFRRFAAGAKSGALTSSLTQNINVTLAMTGSPKTTLRAVQKRPAGMPYSITLANTTPVVASVLFFSTTAVETGNLTLSIQVKPQENGITVTGTSDIILEAQQDKAAEAGAIVTDVFSWLTSELATSP